MRRKTNHKTMNATEASFSTGRLRLIFGLLLYLMVSGIILFTNQHLLQLLLAIVLAALAIEWLNIIRGGKYLLPMLLAPALLLGYLLPLLQPGANVLLASAGALWYAFAIIALLSYEKRPQQTADKPASLSMAVVNAAVAMAIFVFFALTLYRAAPVYAFVCFSLVCVVDSAGYMFGRALGGAKLAPRLSPNKTYSGLLGGILATILAYALLAIFIPALPMSGLAILLLVPFVLLVQFGDLYQSMLKRRAQVKDSGQLIPGHGGIFDRIDGLLWSPAAFYLMIKLCEFAS